MRAVVFANGKLSQPAAVLERLHPGDLVIAADGGARHCQELGLEPAVVIGDFDSLEDGKVSDLQAAGVEILRHPAHKDFTDLELALQLAVERGAQEILVYAALGDRWDQTLANLLLPATASLAPARICLVDGPQEILLLHAGERNEVHGRPGDIVSLIPLGGDASGITTQGLEYPLHAETLFFGATRGVSNIFLDQTASIYLEQGLLLCILIHKE